MENKPILNALHIENFRCFRKLDLAPLTRVNLLAGKNSVGKTATLEALFLLIGAENLGLILKISQFRGIKELKGDLRSILELLWAPLFFQLQVDQTIKISARLSDGEKLKVELTLASAPSQTLGLNGDDALNTLLKSKLSSSQVLKQTFYNSQGHSRTFEMKFVDGDVKIEPVPSEPPFPGYFIAARRSPTQEESADLFGRLLKSKLVNELDLLEILKLIEPRLNQLDVIPSAGTSMIYGDIGLEQMLPISLLGDGMARVIGILLRIANAAGGVILIDEIENGLHHAILEDFWSVIGTAARTFNTQIIATTHSYECIREAHHAFNKANHYEFSLHRLDRVKDEIEAVTYDQEALDAAFQAEFEVR